jgi:hypothetical protein
MKKYAILPVLLFIFLSSPVLSQPQKIDSSKFFTEDHPVEMKLNSDFRKLINNKLKMAEQPATVSLKLTDNSSYSGETTIRARGVTRKETCTMPPIMVDFRKPAANSPLSPLHKLKLVCGCSTSAEEERLVLKEYLTYKIYTLLTDMSFRVRLAKVTYEDSKGKKPYTQYGYFIEDVDAMAKRNHCRELEKVATAQERTDRNQMTLISLFQYMIGNADWSVANYHNIKLLLSKDETKKIPYAVPYDFDYCGLVNAYYALPPEQLGNKDVRERVYRGFPRTMEELQIVIEKFNDQKANIKNLIMNFEPLPLKTRSEMMDYIEEFYKIINDKKMVEHYFISGARKD